MWQDKVYPRVCGGTSIWTFSRDNLRGLSPRVRGNPVGRLHEYYSQRSIPACAGEPVAHTCALCSSTVYPRVCGGTACTPPYSFPESGLSPRVRGNRPPGSSRLRRLGSIPACAGEPHSYNVLLHDVPVYPRVCGGTIIMSIMLCSFSGLSPRVRGNL